MIIGITIPSLIAVLGAILTYAYINDVKHRQYFVQIADDMKENVHEIRRIEKNFLHFKHINYLKNLNKSTYSFSEQTGNISLETASNIGTEDINILKESTQTYSKLVEKLGVNFQKEAKIVSNLRAE